MKDINNIYSELLQTKTGKLFTNNQEVNILSDIINEEETIKGVINAKFLNHNGYFFLTNKQFVFISIEFGQKIFTKQINFFDISNINFIGDLCEIILKDKSSFIIKSFYNKTLKEFIYILNEFNNISINIKEDEFSPIFIIFMAIIMSIIAFVIINSNEGQNNYVRPYVENNNTPSHLEYNISSGLNINLEQFKNNFNQLSKKENVNLYFEKFNLETDGVSTSFNACVSDSNYLCIIGELNSEKEIKSMAIIGGGVKSMEENISLLLGINLIISSIDTSISSNEASSIIKELGIFELEEISGIKNMKIITYKDKEYRMYFDEKLGIVIGIKEN